ncbi:rab guanine nucleotide exchange factor S2 [Oleoguttula sp. CCFEE 5521]
MGAFFLVAHSSWADGFTKSSTSRPVTPQNLVPLAPPLARPDSSASQDSNMAAVAMQHPVSSMRDEHVMDTRTPSPVHRASSTDERQGSQPDLSQEVAMLSTKLVNSINYQTNLDDTLQVTRHELDLMKRDHARVKAEKKSIDDMIANGIFVRRNEIEKTMEALRADLAQEKAAREEAEKSRRQTEGELESLTTALFEEANTMVAAARKETEAAEKKVAQLRSQIEDNSVLLGSQQEQLQDLKLTMEKMSERGDIDTRLDSMPSTPIHAGAATFDSMQLSPNAAQPAELTPEHPLHYTQLLTPVLRNDVAAYTDFLDLLKTSRIALGHSRANSSNITQPLTSSSQTNLSTSSPALPGAFSFSTNSSPQSATFAASQPPLKDSKFYKRVQTEDIEPTLRLDLAPGLSFLSRRSVASALLAGTLAIEPFSPQTKFYGPIFACALCGEARKAEPYVRRHRFRVSEEDSAQRYPLCEFCLGRVRSSAELVSFLRMIREGHWRVSQGEVGEMGAWEEAVKLREKMFWARVGGGVVLNVGLRPGTPRVEAVRPSLEGIPEAEAAEAKSALEPKDVTGVAMDSEPKETKPEPEEKLLEVFRSHRKSMSISKSIPNPQDADPMPKDLDANINTREAPANEPKGLAISTLPGTDTEPPEEVRSMTPPAPSDDNSAIGGASPAATPDMTARSIPILSEPVAPAAPTSDEVKPAAPERRPSAVLERVRRMEQQAKEKKMPGGFD